MLEMTVAIVASIVVLIVLWNLRRAFFSQSSVWKEKVELSAKESSADLQADYKQTIDRIKAVKASNDGKWFSMSDIDDITK